MCNKPLELCLPVTVALSLLLLLLCVCCCAMRCDAMRCDRQLFRDTVRQAGEKVPDPALFLSRLSRLYDLSWGDAVRPTDLLLSFFFLSLGGERAVQSSSDKPSG